MMVALCLISCDLTIPEAVLRKRNLIWHGGHCGSRSIPMIVDSPAAAKDTMPRLERRLRAEFCLRARTKMLPQISKMDWPVFSAALMPTRLYP